MKDGKRRVHRTRTFEFSGRVSRMKKSKRWAALALCVVLALSLAGCGGNNTASDGTTFRRLYDSEVTTLNYLYTGATNDFQVSANLVDCLVEYDSEGNMIPSLAESWEPNEDNTQWTFHIRKGVKWVDYQGNEVAEVTANDWVAGAKWVNTAENQASNQYMFDGIVKNAQAYYNYTAYLLSSENGTKTVDAEGNAIEVVEEVKFEDVGVTAVDDYTLVYTMEAPCPYFPSVLSYTSYMPVYEPFLLEKGDQFGAATGPDTILYNGAYLLSEFEPQNQRILVKNPTYWDAEKVYIERMEFMYNASAGTIGPESFSRGEVDYALLDASILSAWQNDEAKKDMVSASRPNVAYSYFYAFNFEPRFDESLEPDNWTLAVNNENFRQSILHALDRENALRIQEPNNPERLVNNTITPPTFASVNGTDYTQVGALKDITARDSFDTDQALSYKAKAVEELTAAGATFPVKVYMRYNPSTSNWDKECQLVEQQLEGALGTDYIDVIVEAGPSTGFLSAVRKTGDYGLMKCNWGADYADPQTWTDPFKETGTYIFLAQDASREIGGDRCDHKLPQTQALAEEYYALLNAAKAITNDDQARYEAFAAAEAFLVDHAIVIPFSISAGDGYLCTRLNVFEGQYAPYGLALQRYKGMKLREMPMSTEEFNTLYDQWKKKVAG